MIMDIKNNNSIATKELSNKLERLIKSARSLAKSGDYKDNWAKGVVESHDSLSSNFYSKFINSGITLPISKMKDLCPEFHEIIIKSIEQADNSSDMYQKIIPPDSITIYKYGNNASYSLFGSKFGRISVSIPKIRSLENTDEIVALLAHEIGHHRQQFSAYKKSVLNEEEKNKPFLIEPENNHQKEYLADRHSDSRSALSLLLSDILSESYLYDYPDRKHSHPNHRSRIEVSLRKLFLDDVVKLNGTWENLSSDKKVVLRPKTVQKSYPIVHKKINDTLSFPDSDNSGINYAMRTHKDKPVTEDGKIIENYKQLEKIADREIVKLMRALDISVNTGLDTYRKQQWLQSVDDKVKEFKEKYKPSFVEMTAYRRYHAKALQIEEQSRSR